MSSLDVIAYAATQTRPPVRNVPTYRGIVFGATLISIMGALLLVIGFATIATVLYGLWNSKIGVSLAELEVFAMGIMLVGLGLLIEMFAGLTLAIRDIARNSFK